MKQFLRIGLIGLAANFVLAESSTSMKPGREVYAHFLTWFKTIDYSGRWEMWNSNYTQSPHDPNIIFLNGKRDLAVTTYPLTGPYDSSDPDIIEYQFLLMKLSGIDGIIVDWDGRRINRYRHDCLMTILPHLQKYQLKLIVCFEEWCGYWPKGTFKDRGSEIQAAQEELRWMERTFVDQPFYGMVKGHKPVLVFRKIPDQWFSSSEWQEIARAVQHHDKAFMFDSGGSQEFTDVAGGKYFWVGSFDPKTNSSDLEFCKKVYSDFFRVTNPKDSGPIVLGGATPGFDDSPVWGWGTTARKAPRYDGKRFELTWQMSIENKVDAVQVITWNDWNEGTQIEPCDQFGYQYLELNKRLAAQYKAVADPVPNEALRVPLRIYQARKAHYTNVNLLNEISDCLLTGDYQQAIQLVGTIE